MEDIWDRANMQQIASYILYGTETIEIEPGTMMERKQRYEAGFIQALHDLCKMAKNTDWSHLEGDELISKEEDLYNDAGVLYHYSDMMSLVFEMGLCMGMKIRKEAEDVCDGNRNQN